jgi:hypothetical protein
MGAGAVILPIVAKRSRDHSLRRHLRWFGLFGAVILMALPVGIIGFATNAVENSLSIPILLIAAAFCLYKSVKPLIPLNHLSLDSNAEPSFEKQVDESEKISKIKPGFSFTSFTITE